MESILTQAGLRMILNYKSVFNEREPMIIDTKIGDMVTESAFERRVALAIRLYRERCLTSPEDLPLSCLALDCVICACLPLQSVPDELICTIVRYTSLSPERIESVVRHCWQRYLLELQGK